MRASLLALLLMAACGSSEPTCPGHVPECPDGTLMLWKCGICGECGECYPHRDLAVPEPPDLLEPVDAGTD